MKCHRCGSHNTAQILYGLSVFSGDLLEKMNNGKIIIGGCCIGPCDP